MRMDFIRVLVFTSIELKLIMSYISSVLRIELFSHKHKLILSGLLYKSNTLLGYVLCIDFLHYDVDDGRRWSSLWP